MDKKKNSKSLIKSRINNQLDNIVNLRVIFNMEENIQEAKMAKLYVNASWRRRKDRRTQWIEKKKKTRESFFFDGKNCLHGSGKWEDVEVIQEILWRNRKRKMENEKEKGKNGILIMKTNTRRKVKAKRKKKHNAINKKERRRWIENNSIRSIDQLMIDSKWEWRRRECLKKEKKKKKRSESKPELQELI